MDKGYFKEEGRAKALERRIRTRLIGPPHSFGVVVPRELAPLCLRELGSLGIAAEPGEAGAEFTGKLKDAWLCNLWSRTAGRVLCRLPAFRAGVAEELFYKVSEIDWELWINPDIPLEIDSHVEYSRISHEGKVAELVLEGIAKAVRTALPPGAGVRGTVASQSDPDAPALAGDEGLRQKVFVRLEKNHCRISLDMSGRHLHERGYRLEHTGAPLRETLAAAILLKSEWNVNTPLIDGMCGSGTFPIEAALIARNIAPGLDREFLFQKWPSFQEKTWKYLLRSAREAALSKAPAPILALDIDLESVQVSARNAGRAGVEKDIAFRHADFFGFDPAREKIKTGLLVLNPPYGRRLEGGGEQVYEKIGNHLRHAFRGWKYAVLCASRREAGAMKMPLMRLWSIRHGGTPIYVALGRAAG